MIPPCSLGANRDKVIEVDASPQYGSTPIQQHNIKFQIKVDLLYSEFETVSLSKVKRDNDGKSEYLPQNLFAYYSGPSDRLEDLFKTHRTNFYNKLRKKQVKIEDEVRPLFYAKPFHSQFVLLAFFLSQQQRVGRGFIDEQLGIKDFHSVHFVFHEPTEWNSPNKKDLFWGADGVVREFLDRLLPYSLGAVKTEREEKNSVTGKGKDKRFLHLFLPDLYSLKKVAVGLSAKNFFKMLESTLLSDLLSSVHIKVRLTNNEIVSFSELSEGEQQLLTVLGLLEFTVEEDSLFLLDEPDTHLNPSWAAKYHSFLQRFIPNKRFCHILMVTHHPLAIAELDKTQIQVMKRDNQGHSFAEIPDESPIGMGINGILTSDMFGMVTTLDKSTSYTIESRRKILEKEQLSEQDQDKLKRINNKLEQLGYGYTHPDEDYRQFLIARRKAMDKMDDNDPNTIEYRLKLIDAILKDQGLKE